MQSPDDKVSATRVGDPNIAAPVAVDADRGAIGVSTLASHDDNLKYGAAGTGSSPGRPPLEAVAPTGRRGGAGGDLITQAELCRYDRLRDERERLGEEVEALRGDMIRRIEAGVPIEEGAYHARVSRSLDRVLTATTLAEIFTGAQIDEMKGLVSPTPRVRLYVRCHE